MSAVQAEILDIAIPSTKSLGLSGERGATPVVHLKGDEIEEVASKLYDVLGFGELDLIIIGQTYEISSED